MIDGLKVLALIPARGGSKGIKNKNIVLLNGKPLISYSICEALKSKYIDDVVVTTDSDEIARISLEYGAEVPFVRPLELATDTSSTISAVLHAIEMLKSMEREYDILILLQPTQPLRTNLDIDSSLETYVNKGKRALVSVTLVDDHPLLIRSVGEDGNLNRLLNVNSTCRRQEMPLFYRVNGCIYINNISELNDKTSFNDNPVPYIMDKSHSVDIDEISDLWIAEWYLNNNPTKK